MIQVITSDGIEHMYAESAKWKIDDDGQLHIYTTPQQLASYATGRWSSVRVLPTA
mgnify:CR=1 FL=1